MLSVRHLTKIYKTKKAEPVVALNDLSIDFPETGFVFLLGKSGSGKSTLLNSIGGLDKFDSGEIIIKGKSSKDFTQSDFDSYRNTFIGFIFQEYNILENFSVAKNLALALELQGKKSDKEEVEKLLAQVDLVGYGKRKPNELSGGQKQRVAIARALIKNPEIIMADEPTGALDSNTGKQVMDTLKQLSKSKLVIVVSHDREFAELYGDRIIELKDGKILSDTTKKEILPESKDNSGLKIIDDNILYIKKGQKLSETEIKQIGQFVANKAEYNDMFISVDEKANQKLKEGAKINDGGNKEKFIETQPEDIKKQDYNANSLKLIRSRLKFTDSFKMGASSLKSKVGKLIFTILLSFFAFTVFGVIDALSSWNRADSVYQAMQISHQKNLVLAKEKKNENSSSGNSVFANDIDIEILKEKFPEYTFKGVAGYSSYNGKNIKIKDIDLKSSANNPFKDITIYGYVDFSQTDFEKLGFNLLYGNMPANDDEIVISKHIMDNIIERSTTEDPITTENIIGLQVRIDDYSTVWSSSEPGYYAKIVGVVDTKADFSKYSNVSGNDLSIKSYFYRSLLSNNYATLVYVSTNKYNEILQRLYNNSYNSGFNLYIQKNSSMSINNKNLTTLNDVYNEYKTGDDVASSVFYYDSSRKIVVQIKNEYLYLLYAGGNVYQYDLYNDNVSKQNLKTGEYTYDLSKSSISYLQDDLNGDGIPDSCALVDLSPEIFASMFLVKFKGEISNYIEGDHFKDLGEDSAIIKADRINGVIDWESKFEEGSLKAYLVTGYANNNLETVAEAKFNIIGLFAVNVEDKLIMSTTAKTGLAKKAGKYSAILSQFNGTDRDKELIKFCEVYGENGVRYVVQNSATDVVDLLEDAINNMAKIFLYIGIAFAVFASLLLMNFISTSISYKKREIGVLRALGARGADVFGIFFNEASIIAFINFIISAVATFIICTVINANLIGRLGFDIVFLNVGLRQFLLILAVSWGSALLASLIPSLKISKKKPIDAINNR